MTYRFTLPESFHPSEFLPGRLAIHSDSARWLISTITRKIARRQIDKWGCAQLRAEILRRVMGRHVAGPVIGALRDGGAIETVGHRAGHRPMGFRLAHRYLADRAVRVRCTDPRLIARIAREETRRQRAEEAEWLPIHRSLNEQQQAITITDEADAILDDLPDHTRLSQSYGVDAIRTEEHPFGVGTTGRVYNSITSMKKELRSALRIDGHPVGLIDISCSQPALLAYLLSPPNGVKGWPSYIPYGAVPPSLPSRGNAFRELVLSGELYARLGDLTGLERQTVKDSLIAGVLAPKRHYPSPVRDAFAREFPAVHSWIVAYNRDDHARLIRDLQRLESWFVVQCVAPKLLGQLPFVTLHDAVHAARDDLSAVSDAFEQAGRDVGFRFSVSRE